MSFLFQREDILDFSSLAHSGLDEKRRPIMPDLLTEPLPEDIDPATYNSVGIYHIGPDNTLEFADIIFAGTHLGDHGGRALQNLVYSMARYDIGYFLIRDGYRINSGFLHLDPEKGHYEFVYHLGEKDQRPAKTSDKNKDISLIFRRNDDNVTLISGQIFFFAEHPSTEKVLNGELDTPDPEILTPYPNEVLAKHLRSLLGQAHH